MSLCDAPSVLRANCDASFSHRSSGAPPVRSSFLLYNGDSLTYVKPLTLRKAVTVRCEETKLRQTAAATSSLGQIDCLAARMTDDDRAKRLNSSQDGVTDEAAAGKIDQPRSDPPSAADGNQEHGPPPDELRPVAIDAAVDLSRVDTGIVTHISSFLGTSHELLSLGLTCKSFGWRQPATALNHWSLVEEVARQTVCSRATVGETDCLPHYVSRTTTWLSILHRFERLLQFDVLLGGYIEYRNGDKSTVDGTGFYDGDVSTAVSSSYLMRSGTHFAEFQITGTPSIGIVRPMPGLDAGAYYEEFDFFDDRIYPEFLAQRSADWGNGNVHVCSYASGWGRMSWINWEEMELGQPWEGMEACQSGDTVGMLLDLGEGRLTVYKNNRRLGVMMDGLAGTYCWYAEVGRNDEVSIQRGTPPAHI